MTSSTSSTYFQGGDYVELLSAQGKAPAAAWKLHGKILKSFEKGIKGNAFHLDGSTETRMQLPKTTTTHSLGLSQRFLIFQLAIPFTRSFSIEIGFSDFQKIRRRFVFASAFREIVMTSLHVQIPFDARVTRDQWINLVFDLQALTETYFAGSTFRSMESICISGSCKLKRVFTMKDAPTCNLAALQQPQLVVNGNNKPALRGMMPVASYAEMKDIPKQFVFSSGGPGSIPTEYFVLASSNAIPAVHGESKESAASSNKCGGNGPGGSAAVGQPRGKSAPTGAQKQKPLLVNKASSTRPVSSSLAARLETMTPRVPLRSEVQGGNPPSPSPPVTREKDQSKRPMSSSQTVRSSSKQSPGRPGAPADSVGHNSTSFIRSSFDRRSPKEKSARPSSSSYRREVKQHEDHVLVPNQDAPPRTSTKVEECVEKLSPQSRFSDGDDGMVLAPHFQAPRPSTSAFASSPELRPVQRSSASTEFKTNKEVHRRAILAEIQQKLDILSDDDELEAERNTKMFLQRTSIALNSPPLLPVDEPHHFGDLLQHDSEEKQESGNNLQRHRVRSSGPSLKKKSSFAFADGSDSDDVDDGGGDGTNKLEMKKRITKLFDFESLLQDSPTNAKPQGEKVTSTFNREQQLQKSSSLLLSSAGLSMKDHDLKPDIFARQTRIALALSEDEEDQALAQMLIAKRNARRRQQQDHKSPEKQTQLTKSLEVSRSSQSDQRSRSDLVKLSVGDLTHQEDDQEEELNGMSEIQFAAERSRVEEHTAVNRNDGHDGEGGSEEVEDEENLSIDL